MYDCNVTDHVSWNKSHCGNANVPDSVLTTESPTDPLSVGRGVTIGVVCGCIAMGAIIGNILVILSVCTNRRLRTVTNCFVVSLASSDLLVAILVMPFAIKMEITGKWLLGVVLCDMWVSCDVMLCTASILNLCCISLDRYFAITNPLVYATKRSKRLALIMIAVVWVAAIVITCPPILGWQEAGRWENDDNCHLTSDPGYVIYSSLGSFFVPLLIMIFVYARIFKVASEREKNLVGYKKSFKCANSRKRARFRDAEYCYRSESMRLTDTARDVEREEEEEGEAHDMLIETSLAREEQDMALRAGKCLSVRRLHQGLIMNSALAMTDIARAHRENMRQKNKVLSMSSNSVNIPMAHSRVSTSTTSAINSVSRSPSPTTKRAASGYLLRKDDKRRERAVLLRERKTAKTLAIVVGCFVLCWLPFFLMYVIEPFCDACMTPPVLGSFFTWLGYFNSLINPFIYALYNKDFRFSFWRLTLGLLVRKRL